MAVGPRRVLGFSFETRHNCSLETGACLRFHLEAFQRARELQNEKVKVPPRKKRVSVTFESRPFGMTPAKDEGRMPPTRK